MNTSHALITGYQITITTSFHTCQNTGAENRRVDTSVVEDVHCRRHTNTPTHMRVHFSVYIHKYMGTHKRQSLLTGFHLPCNHAKTNIGLLDMCVRVHLWSNWGMREGYLMCVCVCVRLLCSLGCKRAVRTHLADKQAAGWLGNRRVFVGVFVFYAGI